MVQISCHVLAFNWPKATQFTSEEKSDRETTQFAPTLTFFLVRISTHKRTMIPCRSSFLSLISFTIITLLFQASISEEETKTKQYDCNTPMTSFANRYSLIRITDMCQLNILLAVNIKPMLLICK